jgi:hypothetical protein
MLSIRWFLPSLAMNIYTSGKLSGPYCLNYIKNVNFYVQKAEGERECVNQTKEKRDKNKARKEKDNTQQEKRRRALKKWIYLKDRIYLHRLYTGKDVYSAKTDIRKD